MITVIRLLFDVKVIHKFIGLYIYSIYFI